MRHPRLCCIFVAVLALALTACNSKSTEERINEAMPISPEALATAESLLLLAKESGHDLQSLPAELEKRKLLRVHACVQDYSPDLFDDKQSIGVALKDQAPCFRAQDDELLSWLLQRRIGLLLAVPALTAKPATLQQISVPVTPMHTQFARHAGVLFVRDLLSGEYAVLEVASGKILTTGKASSSGSLSDNGRLFVTVQRSGKQSQTEIREAATGEVLQTLPDVSWIEWIGNFGALFSQPPASGSYGNNTHYIFRDMITGLETTLSLPYRTGRLRMPSNTARVMLTQDRGLVELDLVKTPKGWTANVKPPYEQTGYHVDFGAGVTADGKRYVFAQGTNLKVLNFDTGLTTSISIPPFVMLNMQPTSDPDRVLLTGHYGPPAFRESERLLYSLSRGTASVVPMGEGEEFLHWVPEYLSLMRSANRMLIPVAIPPVSQEMLMAAVISQRKPELEARAMAKNAMSSLDPAYSPQPVFPATTSRQVASENSTIAGPVAELAKKAHVRAIGVYEGKRSPGEGRGGTVRVNVMRTKGPIILVLASYEGVRWVVTSDPGAKISAILLSSYTKSEVMGSQAPVYRIGSNFSYGNDSGGGSRERLDRDVERWTGKHIDQLEGKYTGEFFIIRE